MWTLRERLDMACNVADRLHANGKKIDCTLTDDEFDIVVQALLTYIHSLNNAVEAYYGRINEN